MEKGLSSLAVVGVERLEERTLLSGNTIATAFSIGHLPLGMKTEIDHDNLEIGDEGNGIYDVDLFEITIGVDEQAVIDVDALDDDTGHAISHVNANLRVFDVNGNELAANGGGVDPDTGEWPGDPTLIFANPNPVTTTFYIGVAGDGNGYYDPNVAGSGSSEGTGAYSLFVTMLAAEPVDLAGDVGFTARSVTLTNGSWTSPDNDPIGNGQYGDKDVDLYQVDLNAGDTFEVNVVSDGYNNQIDVYHHFEGTFTLLPSTTIHDLVESASHSHAERYQIDSTDEYFVRVSAVGNIASTILPHDFDPASRNGGPTGQYSVTFTTPAGTDTYGGSDPSVDNNDTQETATEVTLTPGVKTSLTGALGDGVNGLSSDTDYYKVYLTTGQTLLADVDAGGEFNGSVSIQGSGGSFSYGVTGTVDPDNAFGGVEDAAVAYTALEDEFVYVGVSDWSISQELNYTLELTIDATEDNIGQTRSTAYDVGTLADGVATIILPGATAIGDGRHGIADVDFFKVSLDVGDTLDVNVTDLFGGSVYPRVAVYRSGAGSPSDLLAASNSEWDHSVTYVADTSGDYYIGVSGDEYDAYQGAYDPDAPRPQNDPWPFFYGDGGEYQIELTRIAGTDPDAGTNSPQTAQFDQDVYTFDMSVNHALYTTVGDPILFSNPDNQMVWAYGNDPEHNFTVSGDSSGSATLQYSGMGMNGVSAGDVVTFDIGIWDNLGTTQYDTATVTVHVTDDSPPDPMLPSEPGDDRASALATTLEEGIEATFSGEIGDGLYGDQDVDFYKVDLQAGDLLQADIDAAENGSMLGSMLRVFDASGNGDLANNYSGIDPDSGWWDVDPYLEFTAPTTGTYYVGVSSSISGSYDPDIGGSGLNGYTGAYTLELTRTAGTDPDAGTDSYGGSEYGSYEYGGSEYGGSEYDAGMDWYDGVDWCSNDATAYWCTSNDATNANDADELEAKVFYDPDRGEWIRVELQTHKYDGQNVLFQVFTTRRNVILPWKPHHEWRVGVHVQHGGGTSGEVHRKVGDSLRVRSYEDVIKAALNGDALGMGSGGARPESFTEWNTFFERTSGKAASAPDNRQLRSVHHPAAFNPEITQSQAAGLIGPAVSQLAWHVGKGIAQNFGPGVAIKGVSVVWKGGSLVVRGGGKTVEYSKSQVKSLLQKNGGDASDKALEALPKQLKEILETGGKGATNSVITGKLSREASDAFRIQARDIWQATTGRRAIWDDLQVHHRIPLEWSHIFGKADPNRLSNLVGINNKAHSQVTNAWNAWKRSLDGRAPTQAEVMEQALRIDELFKGSWVFPK